MAEERNKILTASAVVVAVAAGGATLYFGREVFQPIAIAALLSIVFRPVVRGMERWLRLPTVLAAALIVLSLIGACVAAGYALADPVENEFRNAPQTLAAAQDKIDRIRKPIRAATQVANQIQQAAS